MTSLQRLSFVPSVNNMSHQRLHDSDENSSDDDENSPLTQDLYGGRWRNLTFFNNRNMARMKTIANILFDYKRVMCVFQSKDFGRYQSMGRFSRFTSAQRQRVND